MNVHALDLAELVDDGLTESQARVYLALVKHPRLSAGELVALTRVPRSHLYNLVQELHALGLVEVHLQGRTRAYRARPFGTYLARKARELRQTVERLDAKLKSPERFTPPDAFAADADAGGEFRLVKGRKAVNAEIREMLDAARDNVVVAGSGHAATLLLHHLLPRLEAWGFEGPQVEFYSADADALARVELHAGVLFRKIAPTPHLMTLFVDGQAGLILQPGPEGDDVHRGSDEGLATSNRAIIAGHVQLQRAAAGFAQAAPVEVARADATKHEILVVEDNAPLRRSLAAMLERRIAGARVTCAADGAEGLARLEEREFDLLISDYRMPGIDGVQFLSQAHEMRPDLPRILVTAFADLEMLPRALNQARVDRFLTKPLSTDALVSAADALLAERRRRALVEKAFTRTRTLLAGGTRA